MRLVKLLIFIFVLVLGLNSSVSFAADDYNAEVRYLHVQKGQTLHNIVKRLYPNRVKQWPKITKDIVRLNPHAFINADPTRMKADVRLTLPLKAVVRSTPLKPVKRKQVGTVSESEGSVIAVDVRKVSRKLSMGQPVFLGDKVITGEKGYVRLRMIDDAVLDLRCFSIMVIEEYALNTQKEDIYELRTPVASVGVRGTEYALRVFQSKGCGGTIDADDGFYLEVIKGLVDVHNEAGKEVVAKGETAYVPVPKAVPQKTKVKPGIIKPIQKVEEKNPEEEESSFWWWLLGAIGIALLI